MERTLSIIKPDGVKKGLIGEVVKRFEKAGLKVVAMKMIRMTKKAAEGFYAVHRGKPFYNSLTESDLEKVVQTVKATRLHSRMVGLPSRTWGELETSTKVSGAAD